MELTIKDLKDILTSNLTQVQTSTCSNKTDYEIGKPYTIMTVLGWFKGRLLTETDKTLTLVDCSWVSESKRFSDYVNDDSQVNEEEPFAENTKVIIERTSIIGSFEMPSITRKLK